MKIMLDTPELFCYLFTQQMIVGLLQGSRHRGYEAKTKQAESMPFTEQSF